MHPFFTVAMIMFLSGKYCLHSPSFIGLIFPTKLIYCHVEHGLSFTFPSSLMKYYPPPDCTHIHFLVFVNVQQVSIDINGCTVVIVRKDSMNIYVLMSDAVLPNCYNCNLYNNYNKKFMGYWWKGSTTTTSLSTTVSDIVLQYNNKFGKQALVNHWQKCITK